MRSIWDRRGSPINTPANKYWARKLNRRWGDLYHVLTNRTNKTRIWKNQLVVGRGLAAGSLQDSTNETALCAPAKTKFIPGAIQNSQSINC